LIPVFADKPLSFKNFIAKTSDSIAEDNFDNLSFVNAKLTPEEETLMFKSVEELRKYSNVVFNASDSKNLYDNLYRYMLGAQGTTTSSSSFYHLFSTDTYANMITEAVNDYLALSYEEKLDVAQHFKTQFFNKNYYMNLSARRLEEVKGKISVINNGTRYPFVVTQSSVSKVSKSTSVRLKSINDDSFYFDENDELRVIPKVIDAPLIGKRDKFIGYTYNIAKANQLEQYKLTDETSLSFEEINSLKMLESLSLSEIIEQKDC